MPELPEVETIIRRLRDGTQDQPSILSHVVQSVEITWNRIIAEPDPQTFQEKIIGKKIQDARRRGKFLHFPLSEGHLIGHLRMSGDMHMEIRLDPRGNPIPPDPYDRVILNFESIWRLTFNNVRKFGRMWFVEDAQSVFNSLGPEPLSSQFTSEYLYEKLHAANRQIKPLLMDQRFIAGLGNIYTDESLFHAKIHPLRKSDSLSKNEARRLHNAIQRTLKEGIQRFGASLDWIYQGGEFQNHFTVYQREGEFCPVCGAKIVKIAVGQRGTHFCPKCQVDPAAEK
ncbi:MAG: DNA-formamidopyrimidine glycosylase [Chloroflexota bacterium]|nr:DNA-formamidopyrimidine glycosylase [Chloroflexota bacterium]